MAEETEQASPEAKLNIATYFIMNSPTGEVHDVVADVTKLLNDPAVLTDAATTKIMRDYNCEQMTCAPDPDNANNQVLVSAFGQVDADHYLDPNTGRVLTFDHRKQKFTSATERKQVLDDSIGKHRAATAKVIEQYVSDQYKTGKCVGAVYGTDNGKLIVCVSAKNVHLSNFWTGGWRSVFQVGIDKQGSSELKGTIKINVHYFEDGNVQLHTTLEKTAAVQVSASEDATAAEIVKAVAKLEADFQNQLEELYVNMHRTTFKSMRRVQPVTRQAMNWNTAAHSLAAEVTSNSTK